MSLTYSTKYFVDPEDNLNTYVITANVHTYAPDEYMDKGKVWGSFGIHGYESVELDFSVTSEEEMKKAEALIAQLIDTLDDLKHYMRRDFEKLNGK